MLKYVRLRWMDLPGIEPARSLALHFAKLGYFS
jgi:hypothetical protein